MESAKCFDVVSTVVDEATRQFGSAWEIDEELYDALKQCCTVIDSLAKESDGVSYDVSVDDREMTTSIILKLEDIIVGSSSHDFYELIKRFDKVGFSAAKDGNLNVKFVFPSIWIAD